LGAPRCVVGGF